MDWTFAGSWPYEPRWFDTPEGRMAYVDEGPRSGKPVVLLHGNPTWGYLYRGFIGPLIEAGYRVIVPDQLGFGRSDKPAVASLYRIERHAGRMEALLESLELQHVTLVPHDWGGPIGLYWAVRHPTRVARLCILNTSAHRPLVKPRLPFTLRMIRMPLLGEILVKGFDILTRVFLFRLGVVHRERLTRTVRRAYRAPHPSWSSRTPLLVFPREIPAGTDGPAADLGGEIERGLLRHYAAKPVKIIWAMRDPVFTSEVLERWQGTFPHAEVTRLADAGHFLQEDATQRIVDELLRFLLPVTST